MATHYQPIAAAPCPDANIEPDLERMVEVAFLTQMNASLLARVAELEAELVIENGHVLTMGDVMSNRLMALQEIKRLAWLVIAQVSEATP